MTCRVMSSYVVSFVPLLRWGRLGSGVLCLTCLRSLFRFAGSVLLFVGTVWPFGLEVSVSIASCGRASQTAGQIGTCGSEYPGQVGNNPGEGSWPAVQTPQAGLK